MSDTEYHEGDLIRATKGDAVIQGRLAHDLIRHGLSIVETGWGIDSLTKGIVGEGGWTIEVLEAAPVKREVGWYKGADADLWWWDGEKWRGDDGPRGSEYPWSLLTEPIIRMYTKAEVLKKIHEAAYLVDPSYMYGSNMNKTIVKLEDIL